jgi:hypothetical protein
VLSPLRQFLREHVPARFYGAEHLVAEVGTDDLRSVFAAAAAAAAAGGCAFRGSWRVRAGGGRGVGAAVVGRRFDVVESFGYEALGQATVGEGEGGEHDLTWGVVEVGVGHEWAEAEDLAGAVFGCGEACGL